MTYLTESIEGARISSAQAQFNGNTPNISVPSILITERKTEKELLRDVFNLRASTTVFRMQLPEGKYLSEFTADKAPKHLKLLCSIKFLCFSNMYAIEILAAANLDEARKELLEFYDDIGF